MVVTIKIPTELCQWAITDRKIPMLKIYIFCLFTYSGKTKLSKEDYEIMAHSLSYKSVKQIKKHFKELLDRNWIGYNKKSNYYFIRGLDNIRKIKGFNRRSAIILEYKNINHLREFCFSAVIENLIQTQQKKLDRGLSKQALRRKKKFTNQSNLSFLYYPISNNALSSILHISSPYAHLLKQKASKLKYIVVKQHFSTCNMSSLSVNHKDLYRSHLPNLRLINDKFYLQLPDLVRTKLKLRERKKI